MSHSLIVKNTVESAKAGYWLQFKKNIYVDVLSNTLKSSEYGCHLCRTFAGCIAYADDLIYCLLLCVIFRRCLLFVIMLVDNWISYLMLKSFPVLKLVKSIRLTLSSFRLVMAIFSDLIIWSIYGRSEFLFRKTFYCLLSTVSVMRMMSLGWELEGWRLVSSCSLCTECSLYQLTSCGVKLWVKCKDADCV